MRQSETSDITAFQRALVTSGTSLIDKTERLNAHDRFSAVIDLRISSRQIFPTGHGMTYPMAVYLAMHLRQPLDRAQVFNIEHGDLADRFRSVCPARDETAITHLRRSDSPSVVSPRLA
ncbi:hypothetical protein IVB02_26120 [Bradyrhizobium sp. 166]|uniref:hypothetical protein n=1 Tax=Bradyrhizobium sp. 166 TaxID=2782638 RepID=UPI001FF81899|nr:hypothetical protein [Bradyrhizobium sp. 166]MCK1604783.1 hypothetical protein [Bradyrhizobium sp. 166]